MKSNKRILNININKSTKDLIYQNKSKNKLFNQLLLPTPNFREEILFANKSQKEILLSKIKTSQLTLLSRLKKNDSQNIKIKKVIIFKNVLCELKSDISNLLKEKKTNEHNLKNKLKKLKINMGKKLFIKEKSDKCFGKDEISKLKILNFKTVNEIEKINFMIKYTSKITKYLKVVDIFPELNREYFFNTPEDNNKEIEQAFNSQKKIVNEIYDETLFQNNLQAKFIEKYKNDINNIKQNLKLEQNINQSDIIYEDSLENKIVTSLSNFYNKSNSNNKENYLYEINEDNKKLYINKNSFNNVLNLKLNINLNINTNQYFSEMKDNILSNSGDEKYNSEKKIKIM